MTTVVRRKRDAAVLHLLVQQARGEGRNRLVAEQLLHRRGRELRPLGRAAPTGQGAPRTRAARARAATASCPLRPPARSARGSCTRRRRACRPRATPRSAWRSGRRRDRRCAARSARPPIRRTAATRARSPPARSSGCGGSNWRWIRLDHSCSLGASSSGAPITVAIVSDGYGLAKSATNSQRPAPLERLPRAAPGTRASRAASARSRVA